MSNFDDILDASCDKASRREIRRFSSGELHFVIDDVERLACVCLRASLWADAWLLSLFACDERELGDHAFKVYCLLSLPDGELVTLEHRLKSDDQMNPPVWHSLADVFRAAEPLEREMSDLFGIDIKPDWFLDQQPGQAPASGGVPPARAGGPGPEEAVPVLPERPVLIGAYDRDAHPLRRDWRPSGAEPVTPQPAAGPALPEGMLILPVGPIHAGVIQPGYFAFHVAGEVVEELPVQLGFTHRGIERLFERQPLVDGWRVAEVVAGDSAFAHSLAYCLAVESLVGEVDDKPFKPDDRVSLWRGLLLELERIINHMADCAFIVHDMAFDKPASRMAAVQERAVRLAARLTGNRLLKGLNRPGAVVFDNPGPAADALSDLETQFARLVKEFLDLALPVMELPECRDRLISTGVLTSREAEDLGAAGLPARASAWVPWVSLPERERERKRKLAERRAAVLRDRDVRLRHPRGLDLYSCAADTIRETFAEEPRRGRRILVRNRDLSGDVFARTWLRLAELETSRELIRIAAVGLREIGEVALLQESGLDQGPTPKFKDALEEVPDFDFGIGCVEAWRGDLCYWLMQAPRGGIYRCKVRDPSVFNWPALAAAVVRKPRHDGEPGTGRYHENILADFPLINKSFNLSYAGTDL